MTGRTLNQTDVLRGRVVRFLELLLCCSGLLGAAWAVFLPPRFGPGENVAAMLLVFPFFFWASVRFTTRGACLASFLFAAVATEAWANSKGLFGVMPGTSGVGVLFALGTIAACTNLILAIRVNRSRATEQKLRDSQQIFDLITNHVTDLIAVTDPSGRRLYNSASYERVLGAPASLRGTDAFGEVHPEDREHVRQAFRENLRTRTGQHLEFRFLLPNGEERHIESLGNFVEGTSGQPDRIVTVARDITDRKRAEHDKRRLETELRQAQKMEAIGRLAGGIAHDFNNMLAVMMGYTQLAGMALDSDPLKIRDHLNAVLHAAQSAQGLIQQILTFSRKSQPERKPTALQPLVTQVLKLMRATLPKTIDIVANINEVPLVEADSIQIRQVLMNLCTNGAQAMDHAIGVVTVSLQTIHMDADTAAKSPDLHPGMYVSLRVKDTGHGMTREVMRHIFDPFFTTKSIGEGTGLGLSVVHGIVKEHGGAIVVESAPNQGTTMEVLLPACHRPFTEVATSPPKPSPGSGQRILYIDDEPALCEIAEDLLSFLGYRPVTQTDPRKALERFLAAPQDYDLVITDLSMPTMTGVDLAQELLRVRPELPVLLATGYSRQWNTENLRDRGICNLVMKPFSFDELGNVIHHTLQSQPTNRN